jgi:hypothetical protein
MGYKVSQKDKYFHVMEERKIEDKTEVMKIKTFVERDSAKQLMRKLNGGCGFNGWTPDFFLVEVNVK